MQEIRSATRSGTTRKDLEKTRVVPDILTTPNPIDPSAEPMLLHHGIEYEIVERPTEDDFIKQMGKDGIARITLRVVCVYDNTHREMDVLITKLISVSKSLGETAVEGLIPNGNRLSYVIMNLTSPHLNTNVGTFALCHR